MTDDDLRIFAACAEEQMRAKGYETAREDPKDATWARASIEGHEVDLWVRDPEWAKQTVDVMWTIIEEGT